VTKEQAPRVALVSGGGGGVGRATARRLARLGCDVALLGRTPDAVETAARDLAQELPARRFVAVAADVSDREAVEDAVAKVRLALAPPSVVVTAAGVAESSPLLPPDDALFDRTMATNVKGAWMVSTACLPDLLASKRGRVVHVASTAALRGFRYVAAYVASKHAVLGLTRAMAEDLRGKGVTVNAVCPGYLEGPMTERTLAKIVETTGRTREEALRDLLRAAGQPRLVPVAEVAEAIASLCRDEAADVTGTAVTVGPPS
jgi:NAD(P)-dependent dehydrogenase (short-subunit alcohol dehydrogenase family)